MRLGNPYNILVQRIQQGSYPAGARLPSERALADEFGVHRTTIQRLITRLTAEGYLDRQRGCRPVVRNASENSVRSGVVAVLIDAVYPVVDNAYGSFLLGAQSALRAEGYRVVFLSPSINGFDSRFETELEELRGLLADPVDGLILVPENTEGAATLLRELVSRGTAVVIADRWIEGVTTDFVGVENAAGAAMATKHLMDLGHTKIAFADTPRNRYVPAEERKQGFLSTLVEKGIPIRSSSVFDLPLTNDVANDTRVLGGWLREHGMPTGFVCVHDGVAFSLARTLQAMGVRIPDEVSIVGFDDDADRRNVGEVELTTIRQPFYEVGEDAAGLLMKRLRRPSGPIHTLRLTPSLVVRTSAGPPSNEKPSPGGTAVAVSATGTG